VAAARLVSGVFGRVVGRSQAQEELALLQKRVEQLRSMNSAMGAQSGLHSADAQDSLQRQLVSAGMAVGCAAIGRGLPPHPQAPLMCSPRIGHRACRLGNRQQVASGQQIDTTHALASMHLVRICWWFASTSQVTVDPVLTNVIAIVRRNLSIMFLS
jgi:hypothetical protein